MHVLFLAQNPERAERAKTAAGVHTGRAKAAVASRAAQYIALMKLTRSITDLRCCVVARQSHGCTSCMLYGAELEAL